MRKILRASAALVAIVAAGAFGAGNSGGDHGGKVAAGGGGRGIGAVMNDALQGAANGMRNALGLNDSQPTATKIGAVRDDATYDGVGAIGGGVGNDPSGMGIGGGVQGNDPNDVSGNSVGY